MATFDNSGSYSILNTQQGTYYVQGGHYFDPKTFADLGATLSPQYQSLSSERSDVVNIVGGTIDGVTIGPNSTIEATVSGDIDGSTITNPTITGGSVNGTTIGQSTPAAGAFTSLNATSAGILGPMNAEGVNSTANAQAASITNSGVQLSQSSPEVLLYDSTRAANNKIVDLFWSGGVFSVRFKNDAQNSVVTPLTINGGQGSGTTGITSNSGSGSWIHAGPFAASGVINSSVGFQAKEGANAKQGTATLVAGTVTVPNTSVTANSRIFLTAQSLGTVTDPAALAVTARVAGTSFTIKSADATDTSVVAYEIFEPGV